MQIVGAKHWSCSSESVCSIRVENISPCRRNDNSMMGFTLSFLFLLSRPSWHGFIDNVRQLRTTTIVILICLIFIDLINSFTFEMTDCKTPVGVEHGTITNQQMTSTSSYAQYDASNGRLHNKLSIHSTGKLVWGGWCTDKLDLHQFLQVIVARIILHLFNFR